MRMTIVTTANQASLDLVLPCLPMCTTIHRAVLFYFRCPDECFTFRDSWGGVTGLFRSSQPRLQRYAQHCGQVRWEQGSRYVSGHAQRSWALRLLAGHSPQISLREILRNCRTFLQRWAEARSHGRGLKPALQPRLDLVHEPARNGDAAIEHVAGVPVILLEHDLPFGV